MTAVIVVPDKEQLPFFVAGAFVVTFFGLRSIDD